MCCGLEGDLEALAGFEFERERSEEGVAELELFEGRYRRPGYLAFFCISVPSKFSAS